MQHEKHFSWQILYKMREETIPRLFSGKHQIELKFYSLFLVYTKLGAIEIYWN